MKRFVQGADRTQALLLPEQLDDYVTENNPVRVIDVFVDELDLVALNFEGGLRVVRQRHDCRVRKTACLQGVLPGRNLAVHRVRGVAAASGNAAVEQRADTAVAPDRGVAGLGKRRRSCRRLPSEIQRFLIRSSMSRMMIFRIARSSIISPPWRARTA